MFEATQLHRSKDKFTTPRYLFNCFIPHKSTLTPLCIHKPRGTSLSMFTDWPLPRVVPALPASPYTPLHKNPVQQLFLFTLTPLYTSLKELCTPNVLPPHSLIKDVPVFMGCDTRPPQRHKGALSLPLQSFPHKQMQISSSLRLFRCTVS